MTVPGGFGDKAGEHLRMPRGKFSAFPHVAIGFIWIALALWMIFVLAGWLVLEPPGGEPVFAERKARDNAAIVWISASAAVALVLSWLVFRDRWKCIEAFSSRYCSGLMNLSFFYVPFIAAGYALVRAARKLNGREKPHDDATVASAETVISDDVPSLLNAVAAGVDQFGKQQALDQRRIALVSVGVVIGLIGVGLFVFLRLRPIGPSLTGEDEADPETAAAAGAETSICPGGSSYCKLPLEVLVTDSLRLAGLSARLEPGHLDVTPKKMEVTVAGTVTYKEEKSELETLNLALRLFGPDGGVLGEIPIKARQHFQPPLRTGDSAPFYERAPILAVPRMGELVVLDRHTVPAPAAPADEEAIELELPPSAVGRFKLTALLRHRESQRLGLKTSTKAVIAFRNDGEGVVRKLEVDLVPRGGAGRDLGETYPQTVAYEHMPPMYPGEIRVIHLSYYVMGEVVEERVAVTSVK